MTELLKQCIQSGQVGADQIESHRAAGEYEAVETKPDAVPSADDVVGKFGWFLFALVLCIFAAMAASIGPDTWALVAQAARDFFN
jgi:hypothetical protein